VTLLPGTDAYDMAIDYARRAAEVDDGFQARDAAIYWCDLLAAHRPGEEIAARLEVFHRSPSASTAEHPPGVRFGLARSPRSRFRCAGSLAP
jgi:hypothetical protein